MNLKDKLQVYKLIKNCRRESNGEIARPTEVAALESVEGVVVRSRCSKSLFSEHDGSCQLEDRHVSVPKCVAYRPHR